MQFIFSPAQSINNKNTFGFISTTPPPRVAELDELKNMLYDLVIGIKFRKYSNTFQKHLNEDIKKIVDEERMFIAADKTSNFYKVTNDKHDELLQKQRLQEIR